MELQSEYLTHLKAAVKTIGKHDRDVYRFLMKKIYEENCRLELRNTYIKVKKLRNKLFSHKLTYKLKK